MSVRAVVPCGVCGRPAALCCKCAPQMFYLCATCVPSHIVSPGSHVMKPYEPRNLVESDNMACANCRKGVADFACGCTFPMLPICDLCAEAHFKKVNNPLKHWKFPLKSIREVESLGMLKAAHSRIAGFQEGKRKAGTLVISLETCERDITLICDQLMQEVAQKKDALLSQLRDMKTDFQERFSGAVNEVESNVCVEGYNPSPGTATELWHYHHLHRLELPQFNATYAKPDISIPLQRFASFNWIQVRPLAQDCVPVLSPTSIRIFDHVKEEWKPVVRLRLEIHYDNSSAAIQTSAGDIMCCGRYNPLSGEAYLIRPENGDVTVLRPMLQPRYQHGMLYFEDSAYVFGGRNNASVLSSCEKYALFTDVWSQLPQLASGRECFNPVMYKGIVYIVGGRGTLESETFNVRTERFARAPFALDRAEPSASVIYGDQLLILQASTITKVDLRRNFSLSKIANEASFAWCNFPPVLHQDSVYLLKMYNGLIEKVDLRQNYEKTQFSIS